MRGKLYAFVMFVFLFVQYTNISAQIITAFAGSATIGFFGDGGPAVSCGMNIPESIAIDRSGNLYISDYYNHRIRMVNTHGTIITIAGSGTYGFSGDGGAAVAAAITNAEGIVTDTSGNVYITDFANNRIRKINTTYGTISTFAGSGAVGGFSGDGGPATAAVLNEPWGITIDASGNIYFGDWNNARIRKISTTGIITTIAGTGVSGFSGDGGPALAAEINSPFSLVADATGNIYFADEGNNRIRKISTSGIITTVAGNGSSAYSGDGGPATAAGLLPLGVTLSPAGEIVISDYGNERVRKVNASGIISTIAGNGAGTYSGDGGPPTAAGLPYPIGLAYNSSGDLYVATWTTGRVRKIAPNHPPVFISGHHQTLSVCENSWGNNISPLLNIVDSDLLQTERWALASAPAHGTAVVTGSAPSTGGLVTPFGMSYTPTSGYSGTDTFRVSITDSLNYDTTTIVVTVNPLPAAISGTASTAAGLFTTLSDATAGGVWSTSTGSVASVGSSSGIVDGLWIGTAIIAYTLGTGCQVTTLVTVNINSGYEINTIAGNGAPGYSGDGTAAITAGINQPAGIAIDASGNAYIADYANHRIRKVSTAGVITTVAGTGVAGYSGDGIPAVSARINYPTGVAIDASGNLYISDNGNNRIRMVNTSGTISTLAGTGVPGLGGDGGLATAATLTAPSCVAVDGSGNVYFAADTVVRLISTAGGIRRFAGNGSAGYGGDSGNAVVAQLHNPIAVAPDGLGNVYITDQYNQTVRKVDATGMISIAIGKATHIAGYSGDGGPDTAARLNNPSGIVCDPFGNVYVGDQGNNCIRKVDVTGIITTFTGDGTAGYSGDACGATSALLNHPAGLAMDGFGNIYIADQGNNRVRRINSSNHAPSFIGGHSQNITFCVTPGADSVNNLMAVRDLDSAQAETWTVISTTVHGSLTAAYSTTANGGTMMPVGLYYVPASGYTGRDSFRVCVTDCVGASDTTVIHIVVTSVALGITGAPTVCAGSAITLSDSAFGGSWASSNPAVASVGTGTGIVTGMSIGSVTITYSLLLSCGTITSTSRVTVNPLPAAITGDSVLCAGATLPLGETTSGGVWSSSSGYIAGVGSASGIVSGYFGGSVLIMYTSGAGCTSTKVVTVNPLPSAITGPLSVCTRHTTSLFEGITGGIWTSSNTSVAAIGSITGIATGVAVGTSNITYTLGTGCMTTAVVSVNLSPSLITGPFALCASGAITLGDSLSGGSWSCSAPWLASINSVSGRVTGIGAGIAGITYTMGSGCNASAFVTVNPNPGVISGASALCQGQTTTLYDGGGGVWSCSGAVSIGSATGIVTGLSLGSAIVTYTMPGGCSTTFTLTVNPMPSVITGPGTVCAGASVTLADLTAGGTWSTSDPSIAYPNPATGAITGITIGTVTVTYSTAAACAVTVTMNVLAAPGSILGGTSVCVGSSEPLYDLGGTWSCSPAAIGSIDLLTGILTGVSAGAVTVSYTSSSGCSVLLPVTVNPLPDAISGTSGVCVGLTGRLLDAATGGTWTSVSPTIASVAGSSGIVTGLSTGIATIVYTLPTGCFTSTFVTINSTPGFITGALHVCVGTSTTLADAFTGGVWSSGATAYATAGSATGIVSGLAPGTTTIAYSIGAGCSTTATVTVYALPTGVTGTEVVCAGSSTSLIGSPSGGAWSSGNLTVATVGSITGIVAGVSGPGTATITYTLATGCYRTAQVTVNAVPGSIAGPLIVCPGNTVALTDSMPGGAWSIIPTTYGTISAAGLVTGITPGVAAVTYAIPATGCRAIRVITVNAVAAAITGSGSICAGSSLRLADAGSGTWSGGSPTATVGSASGLVTGLASGVATITFTGSIGTPAAGCSVTAPVSVNALPVITSGPGGVCVGASISLSGSVGGTWSSSLPATATVGSLSGLVTAVTLGATTISYVLPSGCSATTIVTVTPGPAAITGAGSVCAGSIATLADAIAGGVWSSSLPGTAIVGSLTGVVTGISPGAATIQYSLGAGCTVAATISVNPSPAPPSGRSVVCSGSIIALTDATLGGVWSSSNPLAATVSSGGVVTGIGADTATVFYTFSGCASGMLITVNATPATIAGPGEVCVGATITETNAVSGGVWSTGSTLVTISSITGTIIGLSSGTAVITYGIGACLVTKTISVNAVPVVSGPGGLCRGLSGTLSATLPGGIWTSSNVSVATVGGGSGLVMAMDTGVAAIVYTTAGGCAASLSITVSLAPSTIGGSLHVCVGGTTTLINTAGGGVWSISPATTASIVSATGVVAGHTLGTALVTYSLGSGCIATAIVTVNATPPAISGLRPVCADDHITLSSGLAGGYWSTGSAATATVSSGGLVTGVTAGITPVYYTVGSCAATAMVTVNGLPSVISGVGSLCEGQRSVFSDSISGGVWHAGGGVSIDSMSGLLLAISHGVASITYTLPSGCMSATSVAINAAPPPITGRTAMCIGYSTTLSDATAGGVWSSGSATTAPVSAAGTVTGLGTGTAIISYTAGGCPAMVIVTINALPPSISGAHDVCVRSTTTLTDGGGGAWSSSNPVIATVGSATGVVTGVNAGGAIITYSLGAGCTVIMPITVNALPPGISGTTHICVGASGTLSDPAGAGAWASSNTAIATVSSSGVVTGVSGGGTTVSYIDGAGCAATIGVTILSVPAIMGIHSLCAWGDTMMVADSNTTGVYVSSVATVLNTGAGTGIVTANAPGTSTVTYLLPSGCEASAAFTVNPLPGAITGGTGSLCAGDSVLLVNSSTGGAWYTASAATVTVGSSSGEVVAISVGVAHITYTLASGCSVDTVVTVLPPPVTGAIAGPGSVCAGSVITLTDTSAGGVWHSTGTAATVSSGIVSGVTAGIDTIEYLVTNICGIVEVTRTITVNPLPLAGAITGIDTVCVGNEVSLADTASGGTWSISNTHAAVSAAGMITGISSGVDTVTYLVSNTWCSASITRAVTVVPVAICELMASPGIPKGRDVLIYPNPSKGRLTIENAGGSGLRIVDMPGRTVMSVARIAGDTEEMNIEQLLPGVYLVEITDPAGSKVVKRLVVGD